MFRSMPVSMPVRLPNFLASQCPSTFARPRAPGISRNPFTKLLSGRSKTDPPALQKDLAELDSLTTLPNGIRVASEALPGVFSGVGVYVNAGSRYESPSLRGVSHLMDRLAFKSTKKRSANEVVELVESLGGNIQCASSRESMMYQAATFNSAVPKTIELLAEAIRDPNLTEEEINEQIATAAYEIREIWAKPELILPELLHMAAFKDQTLGNPLLCPQDRLEFMNKQILKKYRDIFYRPERMVVAFAGVDHDDAVRLTTEFFGDMKAEAPLPARENAVSSSHMSSPSPDPSAASSMPSSGSPGFPFKLLSKMMNKTMAAYSTNQSAPLFNQTDMFAPALYTGGFLSLPPQPVSPIPTQPNFTHVHIAFESLPINSADIYALATLQSLLGGGGSFSAGGPGKGMYSRLYTGVLNQHSWVESCIAFSHSYTDSGLFGISASCVPGKTAAMVDVICSQLYNLTLDSGFGALGVAEVNRAKNQLRSSLLMNLESRMIELEDLGRQIQVHGKRISVKEMCDKIESLTVKDLRRVAKMVMKGLVDNPGHGSGAPTVVLQEATMHNGRVETLDWSQIQERIAMWGLGRGASG